jgi:hypothetical protein
MMQGRWSKCLKNDQPNQHIFPASKTHKKPARFEAGHPLEPMVENLDSGPGLPSAPIYLRLELNICSRDQASATHTAGILPRPFWEKI